MNWQRIEITTRDRTYIIQGLLLITYCLLLIAYCLFQYIRQKRVEPGIVKVVVSYNHNLLIYTRPMLDILTLLQCLQPYMGATRMRQLSQIVQAMLAMTGRVTMLGISRWTGKGGSYRTVQRFFSTTLPWATLLWVFFRQHLWRPNDVYLLAGDEVVVTKAGKKTYGIDRFFSSLYGKSLSGLSFFALSLISVEERHSFPIRIEQRIVTEAEKERIKSAKLKKKKSVVRLKILAKINQVMI